MKADMLMLIMVNCCAFILMTGCVQSATVSTANGTKVASSLTSDDSRVVTERIYSEHLQSDMRMSVYLPPAYSHGQQYPVLYLLYGYGGTSDSWFTSLKINEAADRLIEEGRIAPLIIVSPDYGNSFGVNSVVGEGKDPGSVDIGSYEDYLIQEVIPHIDQRYSTVAASEGRYIGGASMGGYAALYLGFNYPQLFSKIGSHSSALWDYTGTDQFTDQRDWLYATEPLRELRDPFKLVKSQSQSQSQSQQLKQLQVYVDCGTRDALYEKNYLLYELLRSTGIHAKWAPSSGGHDMSYWSSQSDSYLEFYNGVD